jgi:large subunit ribosomal protein L3
MEMLLGKKVGMTSVYNEAGVMIPVTVIEGGPCVVMQVKTIENDGYKAVQLGFDDVKVSRRISSAEGHADKAKTAPKRFVREMRLDKDAENKYQLGDTVTVSAFAEEKLVDITGTSKGKGFAGGMKRHHFGGQCASHGTERKHRSPGSIASFATDRGHSGKIKKGKKMAGHLGHTRITAKNHKLVSIDTENNLLIVKGNIPGPAGGYCVIRSSKK